MDIYFGHLILYGIWFLILGLCSYIFYNKFKKDKKSAYIFGSFVLLILVLLAVFNPIRKEPIKSNSVEFITPIEPTKPKVEGEGYLRDRDKTYERLKSESKNKENEEFNEEFNEDGPIKKGDN